MMRPAADALNDLPIARQFSAAASTPACSERVQPPAREGEAGVASFANQRTPWGLGLHHFEDRS